MHSNEGAAEAATALFDPGIEYLIADLTLEKLATLVDMNPRSVSSIINRHFQSNFFEFVNNHRIEEAARQLGSERSSSKAMLDIMYDAGFRSKTTFNTLFKKKVGMTPSEYRKLAKTNVTEKA